jgi:hypothetical protein
MDCFRCLFFLTLTFLTATIKAQEDVHATITAPWQIIEVDVLGNIYLVNNQLIIKYSPEGNKIASFSNLKYSSISSADVSDPLRVQLFYANNNRMLYLDNTLSPLAEATDLYYSGLNRCDLICSSVYNGCWVYDAWEHQVIYLDSYLNINYRSVELISMMQSLPDVVYLKEKNGQVYLLDKNNGIYVFDRYASFIRQLPVTGFNSFQITGKQLYYYYQSKLYTYNLDSYESKEIALPQEAVGALAIKLSSNYLIAAFENTVKIIPFSF